MSRIAAALALRAATARHRGDAVVCPVCERRFDAFKDASNRPAALCWRCGSHERHRAQWLLFERRPELLRDARSLLHFSPEWCLRRRFSALPHLRYVTADLDGAGVDLQLDLAQLDLPDGAFDLVICSHVPEHVPGDTQAMAELRRITGRGGCCLVMVPLALDRERTYEDPAITSTEDREREFLQADHLRLYALDITDRLRGAGFEVEVVDIHAELGEQAARYGLLASDLVFLCT